MAWQLQGRFVGPSTPQLHSHSCPMIRWLQCCTDLGVQLQNRKENLEPCPGLGDNALVAATCAFVHSPTFMAKALWAQACLPAIRRTLVALASSEESPCGLWALECLVLRQVPGPGPLPEPQEHQGVDHVRLSDPHAGGKTRCHRRGWSRRGRRGPPAEPSEHTA